MSEAEVWKETWKLSPTGRAIECDGETLLTTSLRSPKVILEVTTLAAAAPDLARALRALLVEIKGMEVKPGKAAIVAALTALRKAGVT